MIHLLAPFLGGEPPRKRNCRMPCPCIACDGKERDHRTRQSHLTLTNSLQENENPTTTSHLQFYPNAGNFQEDTPQSTDAQTADTPSSAVPTGMTNELIVTFTMKEFSLKLQYGHSVAEFEHHLQNAADLISENLFTKWAEVLKLHRLGYTNPKHYKVCVGTNHSLLLDEKAECCPVCLKDRSLCIIMSSDCIFTTGFAQMNAVNSCYIIGKIRVFNTSCKPAKFSELWHGERWHDLCYFWDLSIETLLPEKCSNCKCIISKQTLEQQISDPNSAQMSITCSVCKISHLYVPRHMKGDPRNQAVIIHEDGWAYHSTSSKNSVAIAISKACMTKLGRTANKHAQVYSFVPVDQLPTDSPHKLDGFFEPLVKEIEDLYLYGTEVFFKSAVPGYSPEKGHSYAATHSVTMYC